MGWVEYGGELIWAVGFTSGGAPFGVPASEFDPAELEAMGLDPAVGRAGGSAGDHRYGLPASGVPRVSESNAESPAAS
jgi:hypothetical protein